MAPRVRRVIISSALLFATIWILAYRLNLEQINLQIRKEMTTYVDVGLEAKASSLSFLHGIGLRLDTVTLKQQHYQVDAGHVNIGIRLLPLLLGKIEIDGLDIHDAVIQLQPRAVQPTSAAISSLPFERISLVRCRIRTFDGDELVDNLHMELRNIGPNRETLWELQAKQQGHAISGHGRLNFYNGSISTGFGKLKLDRLPVATLKAFTPESLEEWLKDARNNISGSLTLDITHNQSWAIFGEMRLQDDTGSPPLRLRGKLEHPEADHLVWHDSFIHFNEAAVIAIDGECLAEQCETSLEAANVELHTWFPLLPDGVVFHKQMRGLTDISAVLQWNRKGWDGSAAFRLKDASYRYNDQELALPELLLQSEELRGDEKSWLAKAQLSSPKAKGELHIVSGQKRSGAKDMQVEATGVEAPLWEPLANLLLSSLDIDPKIAASGSVSGTIGLRQHVSGKILSLEIDAGQASLSYPEQFKKPENIAATCSAEIRWPVAGGDPDIVTLRECRLDNSSLTLGRWKGAKQQHLEINGLHVHFDQLHNHAVLLPAGLSELQGALEGSGSSAWGSEHDNWLDHLSGKWRMTSFGKPAWQLSGSATVQDGRLTASPMQLKGPYGEAILKGEIDFGAGKGDVDIVELTADLSSYPLLPPFMEKMNIRGRIHSGSLAALGNRFEKLHGYYRVHRGRVALENSQAEVASGQLKTKQITVTPAADNYRIDGKLRLKGIRAEALTGLPELLQAELKGSLHANIELHGTVPHLATEQWLQSNGDLLIYNGEWHRQGQAESLSERLGIKEPELQSHAFKQLSLRLRIHEKNIEISQINLVHGDEQLQGEGAIATDGWIRGTIKRKDGSAAYTIGGHWPLPEWQPLQ